MSTVFLAAGGTGGHVFPAIATAEALLSSGHTPVLLTDARGMAYAKEWPGGEVQTITAARFSAKKWWRWPTSTFALVRGVRECRRLLRTHQAVSLIGFGGYPALTAGIAAYGAKVPLYLHEQNAVLGRTNRLLLRLARRLYLSYPETVRIPAAMRPKVSFLGTPVRAQAHTLATPYGLPAANAAWKIVVVGGSLGAQALSLYVPSAIGLLPEEIRTRLTVVHQARAEDLAGVTAAYNNLQIPAEVSPFFPNLLEHLADCHLAITRAGASTLAELAILGRPATLVPYPHAADGHQGVNAATFAEAGAAWLLPQSQLTAEKLAEKLQVLLTAPTGLAIAAAAMRSLARPQAALKLAADAVEETLVRP